MKQLSKAIMGLSKEFFIVVRYKTEDFLNDNVKRVTSPLLTIVGFLRVLLFSSLEKVDAMEIGNDSVATCLLINK